MKSLSVATGAATLLAAALAVPSISNASLLPPAGPRDDFRLVNQAPDWNTLPVALSNNSSTLAVSNNFNAASAVFAGWAAEYGVKVLSGRFEGGNRDTGLRDVALLKRAGPGWPAWTTMPVAVTQPDGSVQIRNNSIGQFAVWATDPDVEVITGDFDGNRMTDVALVRKVAGWDFIPVLLTQPDGTFIETTWKVGSFGAWAASRSGGYQTTIHAGDFNGDGRTDLALTRPCGDWTTIPTALAQPGGGFMVFNSPAHAFAQSCVRPSQQVVAGDFDGDGYTDLLRFSGTTSTMIVAHSAAGGYAVSTLYPPGQFAGQASSAQVLVGNFAGPGRPSALALVSGIDDRGTISFAFGTSHRGFNYLDVSSRDFAYWATDGAQPVLGNFGGYGYTGIALVPRTPVGRRSGVAWSKIPILEWDPSAPNTSCGGYYCTTSWSGNFVVRSVDAPGFVDWAKIGSVRVLTGQFGE
jgi:hypothetical protein